VFSAVARGNAIMSSPFSPLARAVLDSFREGVIVFDARGAVLYANEPAQSVLDGLGNGSRRSADTLLPDLARLGARLAPIRLSGLKVGEAVYLPQGETPRSTLAERERRAILQTLDTTGWRLAESARQLGISRTTLWRRLKEYGLHRDGRGRWSQAS